MNALLKSTETALLFYFYPRSCLILCRLTQHSMQIVFKICYQLLRSTMLYPSYNRIRILELISRVDFLLASLNTLSPIVLRPSEVETFYQYRNWEPLYTTEMRKVSLVGPYSLKSTSKLSSVPIFIQYQLSHISRLSKHV